MISSFAMDIKLTSNIFSTVCRVFLTFIGLKNIKHDNTVSRIIWSMWLGYDQSHEDQQYHYEGTTSIDENRRWSTDLEDNKFVCPLLLPLRLLNPPIQSFFNLLFSRLDTIVLWQLKSRQGNKGKDLARKQILHPRTPPLLSGQPRLAGSMFQNNSHSKWVSPHPESQFMSQFFMRC